MKASLTIEASFIYPMIIFSTIALIFYGFFIHDRLASKAFAYNNFLKEYLTDNKKYIDSTSKFENIKNNIHDDLKEKCILNSPYKVFANANNNSILLKDFYGNYMEIKFSSYERCEFIRKYHSVFKIIKNSSK